MKIGIFGVVNKGESAQEFQWEVSVVQEILDLDAVDAVDHSTANSYLEASRREEIADVAQDFEVFDGSG